MISLDSLPHNPGCYLFTDGQGTVIYVGKARDLKKRVSNYFQKQDHGPRTEALVSAAKAVDFIVTNTEVEALLLENTLIKKHLPRYNIKLKDSSRYACIELTEEMFPRIRISRKASGKGSVLRPLYLRSGEDIRLSAPSQDLWSTHLQAAAQKGMPALSPGPLHGTVHRQDQRG